MDKKQAANALLRFLDQSPTAFHSVAALEDMLRAGGAVRLSERESWQLEKGGLYYFVKDGTMLCAFRVGTEDLTETGFHMSGAHHDSPGMRIKPHASRVEMGFERLAVEPYGGLIARG